MTTRLHCFLESFQLTWCDRTVHVAALPSQPHYWWLFPLYLALSCLLLPCPFWPIGQEGLEYKAYEHMFIFIFKHQFDKSLFTLYCNIPRIRNQIKLIEYMSCFFYHRQGRCMVVVDGISLYCKMCRTAKTACDCILWVGFSVWDSHHLCACVGQSENCTTAAHQRQ